MRPPQHKSGSHCRLASPPGCWEGWRNEEPRGALREEGERHSQAGQDTRVDERAGAPHPGSPPCQSQAHTQKQEGCHPWALARHFPPCTGASGSPALRDCLEHNILMRALTTKLPFYSLGNRGPEKSCLPRVTQRFSTRSRPGQGYDSGCPPVAARACS